MTKQEFLRRLEERLAGVPQEERAERLSFYGEMIDDRMEEGLTEEEAVAGISPVAEIAPAVTETPASADEADLYAAPPDASREAAAKPKRSTGDILLLILGFPLWFPLLTVVFVLLFSLWVIALSLWAAFITVIVSAAGSLVLGVWQILRGDTLPGLAALGAGLVLGGIAVFWYYACKAHTNGIAGLTRKTLSAVKSFFGRKESRK